MMRFTRGFVLIAVMIASFSVAADSDAGPAFRVCADPNNPPNSIKNGKGFENEIAALFAKSLGQKLEYMWFPQRLGFIRNTLKAKDPETERYKCDVVMGVPTGYELTGTTKPYYHSLFVMILKKGKDLGDIKDPSDLDKLSEAAKAKLNIAMFDGAPGTTWLLKHGLVERGIPYQTMTGDVSLNAAEILLKDFKEDKINMVIIWGPMAAYILKDNPSAYITFPMRSEPGLKFDFEISMGVRIPDKDRKAQLDQLIDQHASEIKSILSQYGIPLFETQAQK
jgi:quinoprotein dehydrogenase-associated probable ABC transporter substrate-binding protein